ncbi:MAG: hypothetical protein RL514_3572 [Verrucomicrobiota bacterium]|jgi:hypothetical protein
MRTALAARERKDRKGLGAKAVLCDLCALLRPILHRACCSPAPFAERGEKVAEGRMRGGAANADARNPSPRPSPLLRGREREKTITTSTAPATVLAAKKTGNPLVMNRIRKESTLQTPYPAAQGALPGRKRCLTFSEKVANLFGKGGKPFRQGCHTLWDRAGHPRRPGALGSTTWLGNAAPEGGQQGNESGLILC